MPGNAGRGYIDGTGNPTGSDYTVADIAVACDADGWVTSIQINVVTNGGGNFDIGCGTLSGSTFTPRTFVTIDVSGDGTGQLTYNHPGDFTAFRMLQGDYIYFYTDTDADGCELDKTNTDPTGLRFIAGYHMSDANFTTTLFATSDVEMSFTGVWGSGDMNGVQAPASINGINAANIASVNGI
jgi:hypothetical protein